jgi:hypothetical protein
MTKLADISKEKVCTESLILQKTMEHTLFLDMFMVSDRVSMATYTLTVINFSDYGCTGFNFFNPAGSLFGQISNPKPART